MVASWRQKILAGLLILLRRSLMLGANQPIYACFAASNSPRPNMRSRLHICSTLPQFIEWPDSAFSDASAPLKVGVLGDDPFGDMLEQTFNNEKVQQQRSIVVRRSRQLENLATAR